LVVPLTVATNEVELPAPREIEEGTTVIPTGFNVTVTLACLAGSAALVAVTVTVCWLGMIPGAV
jgi:hypothetical protein